MQSPKSKSTAAEALVGIWTVTLTAFVIATLYFARELLIPLALSALLTFLLAPLVARIERWIGRIAAVLLVAALIFTAAGAGGWMLTRQLVDLATKLPEYKGNIAAKLHAFELPKGGAFTKLSATLDELKKELPGGSAAGGLPITQGVGRPDTATASLPGAREAVPVEVVETSRAHPMELVRLIIAPVLGPLGTAALVLVLVICMLFQREDLRNRLIRLIGQGRIGATTRAMDDAALRVSRYLLMQLVVNVTYGTIIAIGLYFIGVPNALLWGALGTVLRFIPYIGPWVAAVFPTIVSLAVTPSWTMPVLTMLLFGGLELILNNVMEPLLYGAHTGVSSIALIVAAVFWTWLWGPVGLVLATPLTVCLVVMGRHVPRLAFLSIVLSDEEALTPAEDCYHRLLSIGEKDELEFVDAYLKANSLTALYDSVFIPVLTAAEMDARQELLDQEQLGVVEQSMRDLIDDLAQRPIVTAKPEASADPASERLPTPACSVLCLPVRAYRDELAGAMLAQLLRQQGFSADTAGSKMVTGELIELVEKSTVDAVCISVVAPSTIIQARHLSTKLRARIPQLKIVIGLWGAAENVDDAIQRLRASGADEVVTSLAGAVAQLARYSVPLADLMIPATIPADEAERLAELVLLRLMDTDPEDAFDRVTRKLARVFDVPIALISFLDGDREFYKSQVGLPDDLITARSMARTDSISSYVIASNAVLVVEDLARDRRFTNHALLKERKLRFYAGVPLRSPTGQPVGSLCILDTRPRQLTEREKRLLQVIAEEITEHIALRAANPLLPPLTLS
jgi:predicted PurR-regulated permease PerM/methylmalonyl-CoA mutase cobalamin-binding subunit